MTWYQVFYDTVYSHSIKPTFTNQGCGIAMPDSYIEPVGQVGFPGYLVQGQVKITRQNNFLLKYSGKTIP
jgi:hypothetical protein